MLAAIVAASLPASAASNAHVTEMVAARPLWAPGEVLVQLAPGTRTAQMARALGARSVAADRVAPRIHLVELPRGLTVTSALERLRVTRGVAVAEPNFFRYAAVTPENDPRFDQQWGLENTGQVHPLTPPPPGQTAAGTPGADIDAIAAWAIEDGRPETVIAVLDSGVDVAHPDLDANIWVNAAEGLVADGVDDDGNGYVDDVNGWDFADNDNDVLQEQPVRDQSHKHGTHVAGIIAAEDNAEGGVGVCPECTIMVLKFMESADTDGDPTDQDETMVGTVAAEIEALRYAHRNGATIVNESFGVGGLWSQLEREALRKSGLERTFGAVTRPGMLSVAAAGNFALDNDMLLATETDDAFPDSPFFPSSYNLPRILAVTATSHDDQYGYQTACDLDPFAPRWPCGYANWGHESVDLAAPGTDIVSTVPALSPSADYEFFTGTSMAAAYASGVAGLLKSAHPGAPNWTAQRIKNVIMNSSERGPDILHTVWSPRLHRPRTGSFSRTDGRLDAEQSLASTVFTSPTTVTDGNIHPGLEVLDDAARGDLAWPHDVNDVYKRKLVKGVTYRAALSVPDDANFDLWIWRPDTIEIWQLQTGCYGMSGPCKLDRFSNLGRGQKEVLVFTANQTGTFYFQATSMFSTGTYHLVVKPV